MFLLAVAIGGTAIAAAVAAGVVLAAGLVTIGGGPTAVPIAQAANAPPTAHEVEMEFVGVANAHSAAIGSRARIVGASCLEGDAGSYVCSFVRIMPSGNHECAAAVLRWTPQTASTFTVRKVGRVQLPAARCRPVKKVLHVLGTSG